ncbi:MAG: AAA family ATPase [Treponema sp.]|nr:AAA family ATPase [Treponema sp.]
MVKKELIQRSPVRIFEKSIHGGLKAGEAGIIASQSGVGKTSVLVQLALDKLLQGKKVIHVSFNQHSDYVLAWYADIFDEIIKKKNLENAGDVRDEIVRNRVLLNFNQDGITDDQIRKSLRALIVDGGVKAEAVIIDGFDFYRSGRERFEKVKEFARDLGLEIWYSCTVKGNALYDRRNIPLVIAGYEDLVDVIIILEPRSDHIELSVPKDRDTFNPEHMGLRLDPKTLLILEGK